jgi:tetratricopeptide (TPR) repeat protein
MSLNSTIQRGISAWEREDYESALATFREVLSQNPRFADLHNKAGLCLAMLGDYEGALGEFDAALALNAGYAEAHLNRGIVLNELGQHAEAQEAFSHAGRLDTRDGSAYPSDVGNQIAITHAKLGDLYLVANQPLEAAQQYEAAIRIRPRFHDIRGKLADALMESGEIERAREELEQILESRPGFSGARIRLGVVYQRLGDRQRAIAEWRRAMSDDPTDMRPRAYLVSIGALEPVGE